MVLIEITRYIQAWLIIIYYNALEVINGTKIEGIHKFENSTLLIGNLLGGNLLGVLLEGSSPGNNLPGEYHLVNSEATTKKCSEKKMCSLNV